MDLKPLPFRAGLGEYEKQAEALLDACRAGDPGALRCFKQRHPRFLDSKVPWSSKNPTDAEVLAAGLGPDDARLVVARGYDFRDWPALAAHVADVVQDDSPVCRFESAVEAVVGGELDTLESLLRRHPDLVRNRSARVTHFDPPVHRATLLHYVAANGVEWYRQKTPKNAVEVARALLRRGAEVDALADMYGGRWTTLSLLVSSCHPAEAGLQVELAEVLLDHGAAVEGGGAGRWQSPLMTALAFGYAPAAEALVRRGARADNVAAAAGLNSSP